MLEINLPAKIFAKGIVSRILQNDEGLENVEVICPQQHFHDKNQTSDLKDTFLCLIFHSAEILLAFLMLVVLSPLLVMIFIGVKATSSGPGIYTQKRVGKNGREFLIFKFRTMIQNAEAQYGAVLSWQGDPRITRFGIFLRSSHLDELLQLINIIKGEMSFIGPRPERAEIIKKFCAEIKGYNRRQTVLPGITGLAQICCPYDVSPEMKLKYDLFYILHKSSIYLNILILFFTFGKFFSGSADTQTQLET